MTPACQPHPQRCVLTMHEVQSIKDLIFVVGGNSESSAQKAIFEILADGIRKATAAHTSATAPDHQWTEAEVVNEVSMAFDRGVSVGEEAGAKAAREHCHRMCNERIGNVRVSIMDNRKNMSQDCYESIMNNIDNVTYRIQSLRSQQEAEQQ